MTIFSPLSFVAVFGFEIRDPGWVKIRIRDKHPGSATLQKGSTKLIFHTLWLVIYKLMRIRIQLITLMRIRIQLISMLRIQILPLV
jgi:hypothetical protein